MLHFENTQDTITKIREHERTAHDLLLSVKREAAEVALEKNVYDVARDKAVCGSAVCIRDTGFIFCFGTKLLKVMFRGYL